MADVEHEDDGGGAGGAHEHLEETSVDESQLKLPQFTWGETEAVKSGEEDEDSLYKQRCKLFKLTAGEWKERGTGNAKLLANKATGKIRLVMRQEKTLKVCANHAVDPATVIAPMAGSDRAWAWSALDFAEGEPKLETFALRLKDSDQAAEFKKAWDDARAANAKAAPPTPVKAAAAPAAAASPAAPVAAPHVDASGPIPAADNLDVLYGAEAGPDAAERYGKLTEAFKKEFGGVEPTFYVRAPGRVNLIGEHIDYHGYSVLPMALQQDTVIAVAVGEEGGPVRVANSTAKYPTATIPTDPSAPVDQSDGVRWFQYVQCGYKGAFDFAAASPGGAPAPRGLMLMIDGRVPAGAGVSSSSALTVSSLLAVAHANGIDARMTRAELGEAGRVCELYIGTMSGGMDQAISSMADAGAAARIDFEPLKATPVALPHSAAFVVSNTLEESVKAVDSEKRYNRRVTEGKCAVKLVAKGEGVPNWKAQQTFRQLQETLKLASPGDLVPAIEKHLREGPYSIAQVAAAAGVEVETLFEGDGKKAGALKVLASLGLDEPALELRKRARHVCSEAERVYAFQAACAGKRLDGSVIEGGEPAQLAVLGDLMTASHASCRDDYECSSPGLDAITALARDSGLAHGSRLTGAGWGGCAVTLVSADKLAAFMAVLKEGYYEKRGLGAAVGTALWSSAPGSGAAVYTPAASFEI